ncbi:MAG: hypothetical protein QOJ38_1197 [Solirubrobacterales bacterium]|jgi:hypothetical protein|nr:hypothetical protein [Solirubrobacterales bacterium]
MKRSIAVLALAATALAVVFGGASASAAAKLNHYDCAVDDYWHVDNGSGQLDGTWGPYFPCTRVTPAGTSTTSVQWWRAGTFSSSTPASLVNLSGGGAMYPSDDFDHYGDGFSMSGVGSSAGGALAAGVYVGREAAVTVTVNANGSGGGVLHLNEIDSNPNGSDPGVWYHVTGSIDFDL